MWLPDNIEVGREWLDALQANSHCLRGSMALHVYHHTSAAEIADLTARFKPLVKYLDI